MPVVINCSAKGHPRPELIWYKDELPIESGNRISVMYRNDSTIIESSLEIASLTFDDTGEYECVAINTLSFLNITQPFSLDILGSMQLYYTKSDFSIAL